MWKPSPITAFHGQATPAYDVAARAAMTTPRADTVLGEIPVGISSFTSARDMGWTKYQFSGSSISRGRALAAVGAGGLAWVPAAVWSIIGR